MPSMLDSIEGTATTVEQAAGIPSLKSSLGSGLGVTSTVAVQFTYPLDADTEYTVSVADVESASGGPTATISHARWPSWPASA